MKGIIVIACVIVAIGARSARAGEAADLRNQIDSLNTQIRETVRSLRAKPEAQQKRRAAEQAREARESRELALPGVASLDQQMIALRKQIHELMRERAAVVRRHAAELDALDAAALAAEERHALVTVRAPDVRALVVQRNSLAGRLSDVEDVMSASPVPAEQ